MKKNVLLALLLCLAVLPALAAETVVSYPADTPDAQKLALFETQLSALSDGQKAAIENAFFTPAQRSALREKFPRLTLSFRDTLYGVTVGEDDETAVFAQVKAVDPALIRRLIAAHPSLKKIDLYEAQLTTAQQLELFDAFREVDFGFTLRIAEHVVRTDATAFSTLHSKRSPTHNSRQLSALRMCRHLRALDIGHNIVDDISWLYDLPDLRILIIALNRIEDITPVGSLRYLEYLEMFNNRISDISPISQCKHLLDLNLGFNQIGDISPVYGLPRLERLWMYSFQRRNQDTTTPEMRETLRTRLPLCTFDFSHYPTLEGWRKHPRYFTMHEIFQTGVWRPWEGQSAACEDSAL